MGINREYKSSVFSYLFGRPEVLREVYCALEGVELPLEAKIKINTLEEVLFLDRINDLSFEIGEKVVVLIEHQSTINPNMGIRLLMYIARIYEKILVEENIYSGKKIAIPRPEFIVLYNGSAAYPERETIRLSDSFEDAFSYGLSKDSLPSLELIAKVYNINEGYNEELVRRSKTLEGYSVFIAKAREYERKIAEGKKRRLTKEELKEAMTGAIRWCIEHNKLKGFLEEKSSEVINMLITEWDWDKYVAVQRREAVEEGIAKGLRKGRVEGLKKGIEKGLEKGLAEAARNALAVGLPLDIIQKITGIDTRTIDISGKQDKPAP
ncbi:MAG: Rpn family recombination-promoting nuclease/putative transposase [Termitinemataceae bacterium]|nr:MAG: Rpn family recombination-promoting nuclease/putative transposase [Termitinemataceae bacterium]